MARQLLPQQRFSVFVTKPGKNGGRYDITEDIDNISLEIDQDRISILSFNLRKPEKHSEYMDVGYHIDFYGGYVDRDSYTDVDQEANGKFKYSNGTSDRFRYMFNGRIFHLKLSYQEDDEFLELTCKDASWGATCVTRSHYAYPTTGSDRSFANKEVIKLSKIVEGICNIIGIKYKLNLKEDTEYTLRRAAIQKGTDWAFLRHLAKSNGCLIWTDIDVESGEYTLYFTDGGLAVNTQNDKVEFVWLGRTDNYEFKDAPYLSGNPNDKSEFGKLKTNQIKFETIDVEVNPQIAGTNVTVITDFDEETGQQTQKLVSYTEDSKNIIYYELDEDKVEKMTRGRPEEANRILNMGPTGIPPGVFYEYYSEVPQPKGIINAIDKPIHGIEVSGSIMGDVNIEPFQSYAIYGVGKWSTRRSKMILNYYLYSIRHEWGSDSFKTELKFKA